MQEIIEANKNNMLYEHLGTPRKLYRVTVSIVFILAYVVGSAQPKKYSVENGHSHNDYLNSTPFYRAFNNGFGSIEADVFLVEGVLHVAHKKDEIETGKTLANLYINPLLDVLSTSPTRRLKLLVDIKETYAMILPVLEKELEPLKQYLSTLQTSNQLTVIITGNRPPPEGYKNYPAYFFFDDDLKLKHTNEEWRRVGLVSLPFNKISAWKGYGSIDKKDKKRLGAIIDSVHIAGKQIRFWAAPDNKNSWKMQKKLRADFIGTDRIDELAGYLHKK